MSQLNRDRKPTEWSHVPPGPKVSELHSYLMLICVFWGGGQNPGAGAAQNLKNCLGHNSVVSSWVTLNVSSWLKSDSFCTYVCDKCHSCCIIWNRMFLHWSSVNLIPRNQENPWSVSPSLSAISVNYIIEHRCLARFERAVKRGKKTLEKWTEASFDWEHLNFFW